MIFRAFRRAACI